MITQDVRSLLAKANTMGSRALEGAAGFTISRTHYEVAIEHVFLKLLEEGGGDLPKILRYFEIEPAEFEARLLASVERFRTGNSGRPVFSPGLLDLFERAFLVGGLEFGQSEIRSGTLLAAGLADRQGALFPYLDLLDRVRPDELRRTFPSIVAGSAEDKPATGRFGKPRPTLDGPAPAAAPGADSALAQFTIDFTARARDGAIDPVWGRDDEIRQMIDILSRRRKNNPILVGEAGVGKTALVEGLALRVVAGDVPKSLQGIEIRSLDLGLLQAGAGVKGEFENRLKSVIEEIRESEVPIVTFIDEAHTLIGAGGAAGGGDAANLLKPALARGELRTIAATTWSEYKKYFEKDAALARRFQLVKVEEPDEERAVTMLRGVKEKFESSHAVRILDSAVVAAVRLSDRFLTGRQLPDKAVDLLDTSAARVKIALSSKPVVVDDLERKIRTLELAIEHRKRDLEGDGEGDADLSAWRADRESHGARLADLTAKWEKERAAVEKLETARAKAGEPGGKEAVDAAMKELGELLAADPSSAMIPREVTADVVAAVVSDWTGIPAGKMLRDQARQALDLEKTLTVRVLGQDHALAGIAERIRAAKSGLGNPDAPQGVFLLVGPSGTGKTETALTLADTFFGGERFVVTINMSEYMEAHTVSRLIGSPPGYVGFGEGGVLTEAVRQRPYSVVLLDEVEKSHPDVMNLFYQVFDKGVLADGEGKEIDFRNTIVLMTSNLASDTIAEMCGGDVRPEPDELVEAIRPKLRERFKPALLARMSVVPYYPIAPDLLRRIVDLKLRKIVKRMQAGSKIELSFTPAVSDWITERCATPDSGARDIDAVISRQVLPGVSAEILARMAEEKPIAKVGVDVADGKVVYAIE